MGLEIPKIDDITFTKLVEEAKRRIPQYALEWTDYNLHDPGITFIELLAWLVEMQIFYLDKVTRRHFLKFLKLLGIELQPALPSRVQVTFNLSSRRPVLVDSGTKLEAKVEGESIPFETIAVIWVVPVNLKKILVPSEDLTEGKTLKHVNTDFMHIDAGNLFYAFGKRPTIDNAMYLGFDKKFPKMRVRAKKNEQILLRINLYEEDLPPRGEHDEEPDIIPSASVVWEYSKAGSWNKLDVIDDSTLAFSQSGFVKFKSPFDITQKDVEGEKFFWLRCRVEQPAYEIPPRIKSIRLNTVDAVQMRKVECQDLEKTTGLPNQTFWLKHSPIVPRRFVVKVKEKCRWREWRLVENFSDSGNEDRHYVLERKRIRPKGFKHSIKFGDGKKNGRIPPKGASNIKAISYICAKPCEEEKISSTGKPNQVFELKKVPAIPQNILLNMGKKGEVWSEVSDFDASKPEDRQYTLDLNKGEVQLGSGSRGWIDPESTGKAILHYYFNGQKGNVKEGTITTFVDSPKKYGKLRVTNFDDATGGRDAETLERALEEAITRARKDLKKRYRAITFDDFEYIAKETPGLRIARTKAVCNNDKVKVIVVPYFLFNQKVASEGFKKTVCLHLDKHRLLTTKIEVADPEYVCVSVRATIKTKPLACPLAVEKRVKKMLESFFDPLYGYNGSGWPFGRTVYKSEVCAKIENVEGVDCVQNLLLSADGNLTFKNDKIEIRENALTCAGEHQIEIVQTRELCKDE